MRIINQSVKLISITEAPEEAIETAARTCYKSSKSSATRRERLIKRLVSQKHGAMLEFADATFLIKTNRGVSHEIVRHRLCSFAQESTRYCDYKEDIEFIKPVWTKIPTGICHRRALLKGHQAHAEIDKDNEAARLFTFLLSCFDAERSYKQLRRFGWSPEKAREVLPNALATEIMVKANLREWMHMCQLRTSPKAHPQIRHLFRRIYLELSTHAPLLFPSKEANNERNEDNKPV